MILGAVLAGGEAVRFGSDKALAAPGGKALLDRAVAQLAVQCDAVVVVGRTVAPVLALPDQPRPGMGPLAGIAAALDHARGHGFAAVLTCGVDSPGLAPDLAARLAPGPAYVAAQPVIGLWPVAALEPLRAILAAAGRHSLRRLTEAIGARAVQLPVPPVNINTPTDLTQWEAQHGL